VIAALSAALASPSEVASTSPEIRFVRVSGALFFKGLRRLSAPFPPSIVTPRIGAKSDGNIMGFRIPNILRSVSLCVGLAAALIGCASEEPEIPDQPAEVLYTNAINTLEEGKAQEAAKLFEEVERQHPYSSWATQALVMAAYSYYLMDDYDSAIPALENFIQLHPGNRNAAYAFYLRALCYYEQIADVTRDQGNTEEAQRALSDVIARFPNTPYARDASLKLDLVRDHLAGKEMEVGRYYLTRDLYLAAINRFRTVVEQYQTTTHVPEALHRLVEAYLSLGINDEAQAAAAVLGYNYPGSDWYQDSYALLAQRNLQPEAPKEGSWLEGAF
jgi:outer membrane protein assembly factor BamD